MKPISFLIIIVLFFACKQDINSASQSDSKEDITEQPVEQVIGNTINTRFLAPKGFSTTIHKKDSFASFLQNLPLKQIEEEVTYFNGTKKPKHAVYKAVVDLPIGNKDLHQCADAVIRLRADYLKSIGLEDSIAFHFTNGFLCDYKTWKNNNRPTVNGNKVSWVTGNSIKIIIGNI